MLAAEIFLSDWASPPGSTIADLLEERDLSINEFASQIDQPLELIIDLVEGRVPLTEQLANQLEAELGVSSCFWMVRERQYQDSLRRVRNYEQAQTTEGWLSELPIKDLVKFGWIEPTDNRTDQVASCLRFFGVSNVEKWREIYENILEISTFRTSSSLDSLPGAAAAWLRRAELEANGIACEQWNPEKFRQTISGIRRLTRKRDPQLFLPQLQARCASCGVAVIVLRAPSGCRASGATRFLSSSKATLSLSFRYLSDDHFWFTFFHEAGHLLLHHKSRLFLEWGEGQTADREEKEADEFAAEVLIPKEFRSQLFELPLDGREVIRFSRKVGISPGIVVGQLQHLGRFRRNQLNNLKTRFNWGGK